jgi:hypothetical protein
MGVYKNKKLLKALAERLKSFRTTASLSPQQVHIATGISKTNIRFTESARLNSTVSHLSIYADMYGVELHEILNFDHPVPDETTLKSAVKKFVKSKGLDPELFFQPNERITYFIENKLLKNSFLNSPRYAKEIASYCKEKFDIEFSTMQLSKSLDGLHKKGIVEKLKTDKKSKYQYRKK